MRKSSKVRERSAELVGDLPASTKGSPHGLTHTRSQAWKPSCSPSISFLTGSQQVYGSNISHSLPIECPKYGPLQMSAFVMN